MHATAIVFKAKIPNQGFSNISKTHGLAINYRVPSDGLFVNNLFNRNMNDFLSQESEAYFGNHH